MPNSKPLPPIHKAAEASPPKATKATAPKPAPPADPKPMQKSRPPKVAREKLVQGYNITVVTGRNRGQGTDANVYVTLHGDKGDSERMLLREDPDNFQEGSEDVFAVESPAVGELTSITVEHDDSGAASAWHLEKVVVRDNITKAKKYFHYNDWLASDRGKMEVGWFGT